MANYKIQMNKTMFDVIETQTGHVVFTHPMHSEAKKVMRHLNLGGGFDGQTPDFFMKSFKKVGAVD